MMNEDGSPCPGSLGDEGWDEYEEDDWECTWCGGEAFVEGNDPGWDLGEIVPCAACRGTGLRRDQVLF